MTFGGRLDAVNRHGINRGDNGPLLRASYEQTVDVFMQSAMYSLKDELNGVTQNVMLGQLAKVGTGTMDLLVDHKKLEEAIDYPTGISMMQGSDSVGAPVVPNPTIVLVIPTRVLIAEYTFAHPSGS